MLAHVPCTVDDVECHIVTSTGMAIIEKWCKGGGGANMQEFAILA